MSEEKGRLVKKKELKALEGNSSFAALLREKGDEIRRDVWMVLNPEDSVSGRIQVGFTTVYPGCQTNGHTHADREEVYFFIRGRGIMGSDGEECEVEAGDVYYVPPGPYHTTRNPYDEPLEIYWITIVHG